MRTFTLDVIRNRRWRCPNIHPLGWQQCVRRPFHFGKCSL